MAYNFNEPPIVQTSSPPPEESPADALYRAVRTGHMAEVRRRLNEGVRFNADLLEEAAIRSPNSVELLIAAAREQGIKPDPEKLSNFLVRFKFFPAEEMEDKQKIAHALIRFYDATNAAFTPETLESAILTDNPEIVKAVAELHIKKDAHPTELAFTLALIQTDTTIFSSTVEVFKRTNATLGEDALHSTLSRGNREQMGILGELAVQQGIRLKKPLSLHRFTHGADNAIFNAALKLCQDTHAIPYPGEMDYAVKNGNPERVTALGNFYGETKTQLAKSVLDRALESNNQPLLNATIKAFTATQTAPAPDAMYLIIQQGNPENVAAIGELHTVTGTQPVVGTIEIARRSKNDAIFASTLQTYKDTKMLIEPHELRDLLQLGSTHNAKQLLGFLAATGVETNDPQHLYITNPEVKECIAAYDMWRSLPQTHPLRDPALLSEAMETTSPSAALKERIGQFNQHSPHLAAVMKERAEQAGRVLTR